MDTSKLSQGQIVAAIGGIVLIVSLFLSWLEGPFGGSASAFDAFSGMDIIMLIVGIAAIVWAAAVAMGGAASLPPRTGWFLTVFGLVVFGWALGWNLEFGSAGFGAWLAMFASLAIAYGGFSELELTTRVTPSARPRTTPPPTRTPSGTAGPAGTGGGPPGPGPGAGGPAGTGGLSDPPPRG
jgi:hypothetical protein